MASPTRRDSMTTPLLGESKKSDTTPLSIPAPKIPQALRLASSDKASRSKFYTGGEYRSAADYNKLKNEDISTFGQENQPTSSDNRSNNIGGISDVKNAAGTKFNNALFALSELKTSKELTPQQKQRGEDAKHIVQIGGTSRFFHDDIEVTNPDGSKKTVRHYPSERTRKKAITLLLGEQRENKRFKELDNYQFTDFSKPIKKLEPQAPSHSQDTPTDAPVAGGGKSSSAGASPATNSENQPVPSDKSKKNVDRPAIPLPDNATKSSIQRSKIGFEDSTSVPDRGSNYRDVLENASRGSNCDSDIFWHEETVTDGDSVIEPGNRSSQNTSDTSDPSCHNPSESLGEGQFENFSDHHYENTIPGEGTVRPESGTYSTADGGLRVRRNHFHSNTSLSAQQRSDFESNLPLPTVEYDKPWDLKGSTPALDSLRNLSNNTSMLTLSDAGSVPAASAESKQNLHDEQLAGKSASSCSGEGSSHFTRPLRRQEDPYSFAASFKNKSSDYVSQVAGTTSTEKSNTVSRGNSTTGKSGEKSAVSYPSDIAKNAAASRVGSQQVISESLQESNARTNAQAPSQATSAVPTHTHEHITDKSLHKYIENNPVDTTTGGYTDDEETQKFGSFPLPPNRSKRQGMVFQTVQPIPERDEQV